MQGTDSETTWNPPTGPPQGLRAASLVLPRRLAVTPALRLADLQPTDVMSPTAAFWAGPISPLGQTMSHVWVAVS